MYQNMDADKMRQVFKRHVLGGEVQTQFALARLQDLPPEA
jgi:(2Fe-2S) ferredoxin